MCGRVDLHTPPSQLARLLTQVALAQGVDPDVCPSWNVPPTSRLYGVYRGCIPSPTGTRAARTPPGSSTSSAGVSSPHWAKNARMANKMINARAEDRGQEPRPTAFRLRHPSLPDRRRRLLRVAGPRSPPRPKKRRCPTTSTAPTAGPTSPSPASHENLVGTSPGSPDPDPETLLAGPAPSSPPRPAPTWSRSTTAMPVILESERLRELARPRRAATPTGLRRLLRPRLPPAPCCATPWSTEGVKQPPPRRSPAPSPRRRRA